MTVIFHPTHVTPHPNQNVAHPALIPRLNYRPRSRFTAYCQLLFGVKHTSYRLDFVPTSVNRKALMLGGGVKLRFSQRLAWNLIDMNFPITANHIGARVGAGIVFQFRSEEHTSELQSRL